MTGQRRPLRIRRLVGVTAVLAAGAVVVAAAALETPGRFGPRPEGRAAARPQSAATPTPVAPPAAHVGGLGPVLAIAGAVLAVLILVALAFVVVGVLRAGRDASARGAELSSELADAGAGADGGAAADGTPEAPVIRRGIRAALATFEDDVREPGDAIVRAWLALQQSAEDAGLPRRPTETPTEFVRRIVVRTTADERASADLLRVYLAARFGADGASAADAAVARRALEVLDASWRPEPAGAAR